MAPSKKANTKRSTEAVAPKAKRAKAAAPKPVDPVQEKVDAVIAAMGDGDYEVPGPWSCREMLVAMAPSALRTLQDERHSYQETMFGMLAEVFETEETRREGCVAEVKVKLEASEAEQSTRQAAKDSADAEVQAKMEEIAGKKEVLAQDSAIVRSENAKLQEASEEKICAENDNQVHMTEKEKGLQMQNEHLEMLKDGQCENVRDQRSHLSALTPFFKKLSVDASLITAMPSALGKKPAERGSFDNMVVQQIEETLTKHLSSLDEKLASTEAVVAEKTATAEATSVTLEGCTEKQSASATTVSDAQQELKALKVALKEKMQDVEEQEHNLAKVNSELSVVEFQLHQVHEVKGFLTSLRERVVIPEPEPVVEEEPEEPELVPAKVVDEDVQMSAPVAAMIAAM